MDKLTITPKTIEGLAASAEGQAVRPSWLKEDKIVYRLDARPIIEEGGHPLGEVLIRIRDMKPGEIYEMVTPFLPAPLIERVVNQGFDTWSKKEAEDIIRTYFFKK